MATPYQLSLGITRRMKLPPELRISEHELMNWCISYLSLKGHFVQRVNVTGGQKRQHRYVRKDGSVNEYNTWIKGLEKGTPDIIGFHGQSGKFIGVEVKVKPNKPEPAQQEYIDNLNRCGGIGAIVYSQEDIMNIKDF